MRRFLITFASFKKCEYETHGSCKPDKQGNSPSRPTAAAILYDSEVHGDVRSDSDIDVLILLYDDKKSLKCQMEVTGSFNEIEWQMRVLVTPIVM